MYQILKDFAGPVATIIASITAARITFYFSSRQSQIAKQQADTALDQLRYNLFEKRYGIYETAKAMIKYIVSECSTNDTDASFKIAQYFNALDEARFFFPDDICQWLHTLRHDHCERLLAVRATGEAPGEILSQIKRLVELLREMPSHFEKGLGFPQLTQTS